MKKKLLALAFVLALVISLAACGSNTAPAEESADAAENAEESADATENADAVENAEESADAAENADAVENAEESTDTVELNIACSAVPHAEILEDIKDTLAAQGITLNIHVYGDYVVPNTAVEEGSEDVNFFQHKPYLDKFNIDNKTHLVDVAGIHVEPMGVYGGKAENLENLADGAVIAVPNDPTNEGRALLLLENIGLITLKENAGLEATPNDIAENPNHIKFTELEAAMVPNVLSEVDYAVINVNYALEGGLNPALAPDGDALAIEDADSPYVNVLVVKEGNETDPRIVALVEALQSESVRKFINDNYGGAVVATF